MISNKNCDIKRIRPKMSDIIESMYKDSKCSECSVVVTKMDFAKILGKFTKVKIRYESGSTPKSKKVNQLTSPNSRLKNNENGMVLIHRNAYNKHPAEMKKSKVNEKATPRNNNTLKKPSETPSRVSNILKENNRLKKGTPGKDYNYPKASAVTSSIKKYAIVFMDPVNPIIENNCKLTLSDLLPSVDKDILPSEEWCIDYLPKHGVPKDDKVYDRIAAELEDLMNNEKPIKPKEKTEPHETKEEFPSIMDILNDNSSDNSQANNQTTTLIQSNLESSDVEAMLLGKSEPPKPVESVTPMEVDNSILSNLMEVVGISTTQNEDKLQSNLDLIDNPNSPSILDETLQKGNEEHLPKNISVQGLDTNPVENSAASTSSADKNKCDPEDDKNKLKEIKLSSVTHVVFKKSINGVCSKSVTCPKNLKYNIELEGKSVELLGAPKFVSSREDLQVLLQIVDETESNSLYILH